MADLYDTVLQTIKDRCPNLNWKLGGLLRELIVEPVSAMQDAVAGYISTALSDLDISTALKAPAEHEEVLDAWMSRLRLAAASPYRASGEITLLLDPVSNAVTIPQNTNFICGDVQLVTEKPYIFTPTQLNQLSEDCWSCSIPVVSVREGYFNVLADSPVTWTSAPSYVQDMFVSSAITGGASELTAQEKANLISSELESGSVSGEHAISTALRKTFKGSVVSAMVGYSGALKMPLYIKTKQLPATVDSTLSIQSDDIGKFILMPADNLISVRSVKIANKELPFVTEHSGSSDSNIRVRINGDIEEAEAIVRYVCLAQLPQVTAWLNATQRALPYRFACKAPAVAYVKLFINTGGRPLDLTTKTKIQEYICDKPLNSVLQDSEIIAILNANRYAVTGAIMYSVNIQTPTYNNVWSSSGTLSPAGQLNLTGVPVALYTTISDIASY